MKKLAVLFVLLLGMGGATWYVKSPPADLSKHPSMSEQTTVDQLWRDVNTERTARHLGALALNSSLAVSAQAKCADMEAKNYWAHDAPDGTEPWVFIKQQNILYQKAGENLAYGFPDSQGAVTGWMNSPPHRANLLDPAFNEVGYGICDFRGTKLVVQHLIKSY